MKEFRSTRAATGADAPPVPHVAVAGPGRLLGLSLSEARPIVQIAFLARFAAGTALGAYATGAISVRMTVAGLAAWECAVVAIYLFNGVMDVAGDRVNGSTRPIARGALCRTRARAIAAGAAVASLAISWLATGLMPYVIGFLLLGLVYSAPPFNLRKRPYGAGAVVTVAGVLTYAAGFLTAGGRLPSRDVLALAVAMSLWMGLIGATTKDFGDASGDLADGRRPLVTVLGEHRTRRGVAVLAPLLGAGFLVAAVLVAPILRPAAVTLLAGGLILAEVSRRAPAGSREVRRRPYQVFMATQLVVHLVVVLAIVGHVAAANPAS